MTGLFGTIKSKFPGKMNLMPQTKTGRVGFDGLPSEIISLALTRGALLKSLTGLSSTFLDTGYKSPANSSTLIIDSVRRFANTQYDRWVY